MFDKITDFFALLYVKAQIEMNKLKNEEDGLETVETVILVGVTVILAVIIYNVLTGGDENGDKGLIDSLFDAITEKINEIFGTGKVKKSV